MQTLAVKTEVYELPRIRRYLHLGHLEDVVLTKSAVETAFLWLKVDDFQPLPEDLLPFELQTEKQAERAFPSLHSCFVANIVCIVSLLVEGDSSRFFIRGSIPPVYLSCAFNYDTDLSEETTRVYTYEPVIGDHQELCRQESIRYPEVQTCLDPKYQCDWLSYFDHYFELKTIYSVWKGKKFLSTEYQKPLLVSNGLSLCAGLSLLSCTVDTFHNTVAPLARAGCVVVFRSCPPRVELFGIWFTWFVLSQRLYIVDLQNSIVSESLAEAVSHLEWDVPPLQDVFYAALRTNNIHISDDESIADQFSPIIEQQEQQRQNKNKNKKSHLPRPPSPPDTDTPLLRSPFTSDSSLQSIQAMHLRLIYKLLRQTIICRKSGEGSHTVIRKYRIAELEYYFHSSSHPDPFVHIDEHQKHWLGWYFHRQNGKSYKGGTYKGLDITIGDSSTTAADRGAGGLLIRAIVDAETGEVTQGPCRVVHTLLQRESSIAELVSLMQRSASNNSLPVSIHSQDVLYLSTDTPALPKRILCSPRVGLTLKKVHPLEARVYLMANYRFCWYDTDFQANKALLKVAKRVNNDSHSERNLQQLQQDSNLAAYWDGYDLRNGNREMDTEAYLSVIQGYRNRNLRPIDLCFLYGYLHDNSNGLFRATGDDDISDA